MLVRNGVTYRFVAEPALPGRATGIAPWRIARAVRAAGAEVIHLNGLDFGRHIRTLTRLGIPVLVQDHASGATAGGWPRRRRLGGIAGVAFTHRAQAEPFVRRGYLDADVPVFEVPESSTHFSPGDRQAARAASGVHGRPAVLWVGRLDANKDPLTILDALELAAPQLPDPHLWCCYHEEPLLPEVRRRIAASPVLAGRVHLIGQAPHAAVETLCRAADFFILGSHHEGSGYALIEAIACGATPIVSDIPSFRRLTGDGRIGALAPVGDAPAFARALAQLAGHPAAELRCAAIGHFAQRLSFERVGADLCAIYERLLGAAR
jgi:glycosyltransferase involved in cell wall biosynthesis